MTNYDKYKSLRSAGKTAQEVYMQAKADGLNEIRAIFMLRLVFDLSIAEAKKCTSASDMWDRPQEVHVGSTVSWESIDSNEGPCTMQGVVTRICDGFADVAEQQRLSDDCNQFFAVTKSNQSTRIPLSVLHRSTIERLEDWLKLRPSSPPG